MLKQFKTTLQNFSKETLLRNNYKTLFLFLKIEEYKKTFKTERIKDYFNIQSGFAFKSEDYEEDGIPSIRIGDVGNNFDISNMVFLPEEYKEKYKNYLLKKDDIIVGLTGDGKLKVDYVLEDDKYLLNQRVGALRKKKDYNLRFLYLLLDNSTFIKNQFLYLSNGKTQLNISPFDFLQIKIPNLPLPTQNEIVSKIEPIEQKIKELKATIKDPKDVINEVFARDFGFDLEKFEELKKQKFFKQSLCKINTNLIRSTIIQNSLYTNFLKNFLSSGTIYLKDLLEQDIKRGVQPEYTEDGVKVIKTLNIQKGKIDNESEFSFVSGDFYFKNQEKAAVNQYDLLLTSTGMGRGKFALYEDEEVALLDSHVSKIVLNKEKINPFFLNYYCQSFFGDGQLRYIEMHIKGTPEIYAEQLKYFQIPDISLGDQQKIVDEIKEELDKQELIKKDIEKERSKIDELIEESIRGV